MKKRLLALTLGVSMTAGLLSGCGGGSNDTPATTPADNTTEAPASDEGTDTPAADNTAAAGEFNWKAYEGTQIDVLFSEHTYADAVEAKLADFEALTGIKVNYSSMPESNYFDKLNVEPQQPFRYTGCVHDRCISVLGVCKRRQYGAS